MKLSLEALSVLDAIERTGSFTQAAQELYRVPSAISYAVRKLEDDLDVELFDRSGPRPKLTNAGRALLHEGRLLLQAARTLEERTRRIATGWEDELRVAVHQLLPLERLIPVCTEFYALQGGTRLSLSSEVLGGNWDALHTGRADLVVGAPGDHPSGGGYSTRALGAVRLCFAMAPSHPLARVPEPLANTDLQAHRTIKLADSSRELRPQSRGVIGSRDTLVVPDMRTKFLAQCEGVGVGWLPEYLARPAEREGRLVVRSVTEPLAPEPLFLAWRSDRAGRALGWFVERLSAADVFGQILIAPGVEDRRRAEG